jgi:hypothetical protein
LLTRSFIRASDRSGAVWNVETHEFVAAFLECGSIVAEVELSRDVWPGEEKEGQSNKSVRIGADAQSGRLKKATVQAGGAWTFARWELSTAVDV